MDKQQASWLIVRAFGLSDVNGVGIVFGQEIEHR